MKIYPELKKIASCCDKIERLSEKLSNKFDADGMNLFGAQLLSGCTEKNGHLYQNGRCLDNCGLQNEEYYCQQHAGYCEDYYYGTLYFKTDVPGQFVSVPFEA